MTDRRITPQNKKVAKPFSLCYALPANQRNLLKAR